jgi:hypothetical protein
MRRRLLFAVLALFFCGCQSITHPKKVKPQQEIHTNIPSGEAPPFGPPP